MRFLLISLLLLGTPLRALDCGGTDLLGNMPQKDRLQLEAAAGITPFPEGLLWRATKGDTTLTIFGTYHMAHTQTVAQTTALLPLASAADFSFFEINSADKTGLEQTIARDPSVMFTTTGPTLPESLPETDWQRLRIAMAARGFPAFSPPRRSRSSSL
ncbi:TraB/GumN family protein [Aquicoccus sp. G2-2]|uniref:TraB/GumN family protein n=1 Tax=Aquicoccus sp. G2-2 TaxID=3092120 RepID=UPI002ADFDBA0|nr:TraB/GumN family protein [Aquicoccus sp. G2-2]MEA1112142.1 TraB/GumN family protein [Aquicoccus sp. G2-2]